jgi:D-3-phosphoglycerate dehydrogenase / 2-oxoglutarate reductase
MSLPARQDGHERERGEPMAPATGTVKVVRVGVPLEGDQWAARVAAAGGELVMVEAPGEDQAIAACRDADIIINAGTRFTARVIDALERCRLLIQSSVGYDRIDVEAATARGIMVANLPDYCIEEVAEHAITLLLASARRIPTMERLVRDGSWNQGSAVGKIGPVQRLSTTTLGIVGFGKIGRLVARKSAGLGWRILTSDPFVTPEAAAEHGATLVSLDDLLAESNYVTIHVLLSAATRHLIGARELALMRPGAFLVNTCRGPVVDEPALIEALRSGHLAGAGLDVFEEEPLALDSPLRDLPNVILTPHTAVYSEQAMANWRREPIEEAVRVMGGRWPRGMVNRELKQTLSGYRD